MGKVLDNLTKLGSRLRCVANGDSFVNEIRSQFNGAVRKTDDGPPPARARDAGRLDDAVQARAGAAAKPRPRRGPRQNRLADDVEVNVFTLFDNEQSPTPRIVERRSGRIGMASVRLSDLARLEGEKSIQSVELAESLKAPDYSVSGGGSVPPKRENLKEKEWDDETRQVTIEREALGEGVIIGIIDVGGIDFAHPSFIDEETGRSRVVAIWDQGGDAFAPPKLPIEGEVGRKSPATGSEITEEMIDFAIREAANARLSPHDLAPQSQMEVASHATHVASIAAGRHGLCPKAEIACVMVSLPRSDTQRRKSFYDTRSIMDGITYLLEVGRKRGNKPVSINISLGTNGGAHDGSELPSRWIDKTLFNPGRSICVAAGNSGQERALIDGDLGYWSGRVHTSGHIRAQGLRRDIDWIVTGDGLEDVSENEVEIWYGPSDTFNVELRTPDGIWIGPVTARSRIENLMLECRTFVSIYNEISDPRNGDNKISIFLSPYMRKEVIGVQAGTWRIRLTGRDIRDGRFHAWIERDDPRRSGAGASQWALPSYFGEDSYVDDSTVSSLACGPRVIGVANLDEARERINVSSSQGPTRDGRSKPEIAAPGTRILAAKGFDPDERWIEMTGTSMASPYVAGVAGLMLSLNPKLTAAQIAGIMQRTSKPLPGVDYAWDGSAGYGRINPQECLNQAIVGRKPVKDLTRAEKARLEAAP